MWLLSNSWKFLRQILCTCSAGSCTLMCCFSFNVLSCSLCFGLQYKTAELSQRRLRGAPNIWVPWKVLRVLTTHPATFPEICNGLLLIRSILRMCVRKLKFVALPVPGIIGGTQKIWTVPVIKKQTYTKTETCKLYSKVFWIFLANVIKIDRYNFELYRFTSLRVFLRHSVGGTS